MSSPDVRGRTSLARYTGQGPGIEEQEPGLYIVRVVPRAWVACARVEYPASMRGTNRKSMLAVGLRNLHPNCHSFRMGSLHDGDSGCLDHLDLA
jgi:hypothetical protein